MLDDLFHRFKKEVSFAALTEVLTKVKELMEIFEKDYLADKSLKNGAIDALEQLLESFKTPTTDSKEATHHDA